MQYQIHIKQHFNIPLAKVFGDLSDHFTFGEIVGARMVRVVDSNTDYINGEGSVRRISSLMIPTFEETITRFEPNRLIEYTITDGSPLQNHRGRMQFSTEGDGTVLDYTIEFEPKNHIPGWGELLRRLIRYPISSGLRQYAKTHGG